MHITIPPRLWEFGRSALAGLPGFAIHNTILVALTEYYEVWYLVSFAVAFIASVSITFLLQKFLAFNDKRTDVMPVQMWRYFRLRTGVAVVTAVCVYFAVEELHFWYWGSQVLIGTAITALAYFFTEKIFKMPARR